MHVGEPHSRERSPNVLFVCIVDGVVLLPPRNYTTLGAEPASTNISISYVVWETLEYSLVRENKKIIFTQKLSA